MGLITLGGVMVGRAMYGLYAIAILFGLDLYLSNIQVIWFKKPTS